MGEVDIMTKTMSNDKYKTVNAVKDNSGKLLTEGGWPCVQDGKNT